MKYINPIRRGWAKLLLAGAAFTLLLTSMVNPAWAAKPSKPPPPPPASYTYLNLGSLEGGYGSVRAINNAGLVVGQSILASGAQRAFIVVPQDTNGDGKPDLWNPVNTPQGANPLMTDLGLPSDVAENSLTYAMDINDLGQVVGYCHGANYSSPIGPWVIVPKDSDGNGQPDTWYYDDGSGGNGLMVPLQLTGGYADWIAINNLGQIAATADDGGFLLIPIDADQDGQLDTWYQDADGNAVNDLLVDLGQALTVRGELVNLRPRDLNDLGQIVGTIPPGPTGGRDTPFLLTPKLTMTGWVWFEDLNGDGENDLIVRLPLPVAGAESVASVINNAGRVGGAYRNSRGFMRAMLWKADAQGVLRYTDLGVPQNEEHTGAHGINDADQVVGFAHTYRAKAVYLKASGWIWENGVMTDVRTLMDKASELSGLKMENLGINHAGLMVGWTSASETTSPRWPWIAVPIQ